MNFTEFKFKDVKPLMAFFNFLPCCKMVHCNKEFSCGNKNLAVNHKSQPVKFNTGTYVCLVNLFIKNRRLILFKVNWATCSERLCQTYHHDF